MTLTEPQLGVARLCRIDPPPWRHPEAPRFYQRGESLPCFVEAPSAAEGEVEGDLACRTIAAC